MHSISRIILFLSSVIWHQFGNAECSTQTFHYTVRSSSNIRKGPGSHYPVFFIVGTRHYPLKEILTFGDWIKVSDFQNSTGWIYKNIVSKKHRTAIFLQKTYLYKKASTNSKRLALIHPYNTAIVLQSQDDFTKISIQGLSGWVESKCLWGNLQQ